MSDPTIIQGFTQINTGGPPKPARRPLHVFFLCDTSQSMEINGRIHALNAAMESGIQIMVDAQNDPAAKGDMLVRAISFNSQVDWEIMAPTPVASVRWQPLSAQGLTCMGRALSMVAAELHTPPMETHAYPPAIILITDGEPTDNFAEGLAALNAAPWGRNSVRVAIAIDNAVDQKLLNDFCFNYDSKHKEANKVIVATDVSQIKDAIIWVTQMVSQIANKGNVDVAAAASTPANVTIMNPGWS